jgi:hypothetical protein
MKIPRSPLIIPAISLLLMSGCVTAPPKSEYTALAQAGSDYAVAVDKVLAAAGAAHVDATSWSLVQVKDMAGVVSEEKYSTLAEKEKKLLMTMRQLKESTQLLADYFAQLELLSSADAPGETKEAVGHLVDSMNKLADEVHVASPELFKALPQLAKIAVSTRIDAALQRELTARQTLIRTQMLLHEQLLKEVGENLASSLTTEAALRDELLVRKPLLSEKPLDSPEDWVAKRRTAMLLAEESKDVKDASKAAEEMRLAFEQLLTGKDVENRIRALVGRIRNILTAIHAVNS